MEKLTKPKELTWLLLKKDIHISPDRRWAIVCDYAFREDDGQLNGNHWIICCSVNANSDWVGIEIALSLAEAKAAVMRLIDSGDYEYG